MSCVELNTFDCDSCTKVRRKHRGCHGGAPQKYFDGTPWQTDVCPRRLWIDTPQARAAFELYAATEGRAPYGDLDRVAAWVWDAWGAIDQATAWRISQK